ncbi:hypothetical protein D7W81_14425 [Corallococcus aberystwythensis]|uniref:Uncharacterized protein n=2 Tax=Corallococcus aberystwythensis TaxID=2316722 RepID=A0A3A8QVD6_9BACT|nr:hypothetical protein D7W81_14425 [Corallococcus aberystwythensis]
MFVVLSMVMGGCSTRDTDSDADSGVNTVVDAGTDGGLDAGADEGLDAGIDGGFDAGTDGGLDAGIDGGLGTCTQDEDCLASELCHPSAKRCVQTCITGADCPDTAKACDLLSPTGSQRICKCSTDALCNEGRSTSELVCSIPDAICTPKCTADAECAEGQRCDTSNGHCKVRGDTGAACTEEGQSNCDYGTHFCASHVCTALGEPTCPSYINFPNKDRLGTTGPILYGARLVRVSTDAAACGSATATKRVDVALSAYSNTPFPTRAAELGGFFRVRVDGSPQTGLSFVFPGNAYTVSGENRERAEIVVSLCVEPTSTTHSGGFHFTNGNFFCFQVDYQAAGLGPCFQGP